MIEEFVVITKNIEESQKVFNKYSSQPFSINHSPYIIVNPDRGNLLWDEIPGKFEGYPIYTYEQWSKSLHEMANRRSRWCILVTEENLKEVGEYFNKQTGKRITYDQTGFIGRYLNSHCQKENDQSIIAGQFGSSYSTTIAVYKIIDLQTFRNITMKKIIGYKAPTDLFKGEIKKDTIYMPLQEENPTRYEATTGGHCIDGGITNLPSEIVETWEAVYEAESKKMYLGTPSREFTILNGDICVMGGDGRDRHFVEEQLEYLIAKLSVTSIPSSGLSVEPIGVKIGCDDGTTLTLKDLLTLKASL